jgi:glutamine amidotransferase
VKAKSVVVLDYGSGNLRSAQRALQRVGASVEVTADLEAAGPPMGWWCRASALSRRV